MTEIERIKQEGWLPETFWKEEVRCGHLVTAEMKQLWAIMLDLYKEFARVCEKNGLEFYVFYGTMLGAIRHNGFIPWDDDLDVCMPRSSYEKLKGLAGEFKEPYFLQNVYTDPNYGYAIQRLRNSNTTMIVEPFKYNKMNHGIHMDICVMDKVTKEDYLERRTKINELIMQNSARMRIDYPNKDAHSLEVIEKYYKPGKSAKAIFEEMEAIAAQDENLQTDYASCLTSTFYPPEKTLFSAKAFEGFETKEFECLEIRVPAGYEEFLSTCYGDYMKFPAAQQRESIHRIEAYPEIPYKQYYKENLGIELCQQYIAG